MFNKIYKMEFNTYGIQNLWKFDGDVNDTIGTQNGVNVSPVSYTTGKMNQGLSFSGVTGGNNDGYNGFT